MVFKVGDEASALYLKGMGGRILDLPQHYWPTLVRIAKETAEALAHKRKMQAAYDKRRGKRY